MDLFLKRTIKEAGSLLNMLDKGSRRPIYKKRDSLSNEKEITSEADQKIEQFIIERIQNTYPTHKIISEEQDNENIELEDFNWIIDPIDGTDNFCREIYAYSISISLSSQNGVIMGAVYIPYFNHLYFAQKGKGATLNDKPISVSQVENLQESVVYISTYKSFKKYDNETIFRKILNEIENVRISASTALEICYVASGACEARILANAKIWDYSAAALIVKEANGKVTDWKGQSDYLHSELLVVSNGKIHSELLNLLI